ncbi:MATE family efflux transporter [Acinetobacter sp. NIPH 298]|uniref:MATE family efflux transporter n=1 Tax=Acinetobacter sp. NIPH 298 TaxID=1217692 RepID=UPI00039D5A53|nr:MATE family efflux transporter [Acinetobacter sp. NIPH 298]
MNRFLSIFFPILLSNTIFILSSVIDTAFISHYSHVHLTALSVALSVYMIVFVVGYGLLQGLFQILAEENGRGLTQQIKNRVVGQAVLIVLVFGLFAVILINNAGFLFAFFEASEMVQVLANNCLMIFSLDLLIRLFIRILTIQVQILDRPVVVTYIGCIFLVVKIPLSYGLINGLNIFELPPLGVYGAVLSTLIGDSIMLILLYGYMRRKAVFNFDLKAISLNLELLFRLLRIGIPTAMMIVIDVIAFMAISILALPLGTVAIASHQVIASICSMLYILPAAFSITFSIMLSEKIGANQKQIALLWSKKAFQLIFILAVILCTLLFIFRDQLIALFTQEQAVIQITTSLFILGILFHLADAMLGIFATVLRCWGITIVPSFIYCGSLLLFGLCGGQLLAYWGMSWGVFSIAPLGIYGFWFALVSSYSLAVILCFLCFKYRGFVWIR